MVYFNQKSAFEVEKDEGFFAADCCGMFGREEQQRRGIAIGMCIFILLVHVRSGDKDLGMSLLGRTPRTGT
jgi:hypothetical protein